MTRFVGAILIVATVSVTAMAQQKEPPTESKTEAALSIQRLKETLLKLDSLSLPPRLTISSMQWIPEDGGLFIIFGDMKIPVPGGGASGCFTQDLSERIEKLKIVVEAIRNVR